MKKYTLILLSALLCSCNSFLDLKPHGKIIPKTVEEFSALEHSILNDIENGKEDVLTGNFSSVYNYEGITDNIDNIARPGSYPAYVGKNMTSLIGNYSELYEKIKDCNIILDEIKESEKDSEIGKKVLATAYAIRGLAYYNLIRVFCDPVDKANVAEQLGVPIVTSFDIEGKPLRSDLKTCFELIIDDFKKSIELEANDEDYMFTTDVVKALLARTYFLYEEWDSARIILEELLKKYPLLSGDAYKSMMNAEHIKEGNIIFKSYTNPGASIISYNSTTKNSKSSPVSKFLFELFDANDIRKDIWFNKLRENNKVLSYRIRSAEYCLMIAEAYYHLGDRTKALEYLNILRDKRITANVHYTEASLPEIDPNYLIKLNAEDKAVDKLLYAILIERQMELYMEGDRWFELKRNGRPEMWTISKNYKYVTEAYMYTIPIPSREFVLNPKLKQNTGYNY
ncbi:MAG: RagB/SusD family nutrient uptake outer membrane protein [Marinifilaceae bacterium]|jgi:tetratricopeptide (TPR) repeat protein|nr:RagB/SusD family nutrient uptake outer membrane protein [Marinifilaceae bacterium]